MIFLKVIWMAAAILIAVAICFWIGLLLVHVIAAHRDRRAAAHADVWLDRLLDVMEGSEPPDILPVPKSLEETEAVINLLRTLTERFSGSYGDRMLLVLNQIRAVEYGMRLLQSRHLNHKVRGCALLGACGPNAKVDRALGNALDHRDARVVLEAASALVRRGVVHDVEHMVRALCRSRAAKSLLAHDLFRRWGQIQQSDWSDLLKLEWSDDGWILLLQAAGASGRSEWTDLIAQHANHKSPLVVKAVLSALENLGEPKGAAIAKVACEHPNAQVRRQAVKTIEACGELNDCYDALLKLLTDESFEVRRVAFDGILKLGGRSRLSELNPVDHWQSELFKEEGLQTL